LIGTGSRSNALTDFQHTIYHVHAPVCLEDGRSMYMPTLEALHEIVFAPDREGTQGGIGRDAAGERHGVQVGDVDALTIA